MERPLHAGQACVTSYGIMSVHAVQKFAAPCPALLAAQRLSLRLAAMSDLYNHMVVALREHWSAHANTYPQRFELTDVALHQLNATRKLVNDTMNYVLRPGWEHVFLGVPLQGGRPENVLVAADGALRPLGTLPAEG